MDKTCLLPGEMGRTDEPIAPLTPEQIAEIERRIKEYDADPSKAIPWEIVKERILGVIKSKKI